MSVTGRLHKLFIILLLSVGLAAILGSWLFFAQAAMAELPPRPPAPQPERPASPKLGATIRLYAPGVVPGPAGAWSVVQWLDGVGNWHTVEGWQGTLELDLTKTWWVAHKDLGTGPFRWVVYDQRDGTMLGASSAFDLPAVGGQLITVEVPVQADP